MPFVQSSILDPQSSAGGPRNILRPFDEAFVDFGLERSGFGGGFGGGGGGRFTNINFDPIVVLPPPVPTLAELSQLLSAGLTSAQLDQAARFETQEGAAIRVFYGKILFGSGTIVSHLYEVGPPKRNTFTVQLGEGWGGLGRRGEWNRIVTAWYKGEELTKRFDYTVWFEDRLPLDAVADPGQDGWNWIQINPKPYAGRYAHQSPNIAGQHQHFFTNATQGLAIGAGDTISCWIYLDPTNPPTEVMMQFNIGADGEHRAYWGANSIALGTNGTNSRRQISASVPTAGQWVRLDVPASQVGLEGTTINGMAFLLFGGAATWDRVMRWKNDMGGGNTGYIFRPGTIASDINDLVQVQDLTTWPSGLAYSGSAAATVRLSEAQSAEDRPDGFKCIAECSRTPNYDATGAEIVEQYGYAPSPARAVADRFLHFYQRRYRDRLDIAQEKFRARTYWPSWIDWRDNSAQLIPWDRLGDGVNVFVPRAEFHGGFTGDVTMAQILDEICGQSFTMWQDDGEQIIFLPPTPRGPVHHFHPGNIVRAPQRSVQKLKSRPNRVILHFRDIEDQYLGEGSVEPPADTLQHQLREDSISRVGEMRSERQVGNMSYSQAYRLAEYTARLVHDNPVRVNLVGNATAIHLAKADLVTVSHPELGWEYQLCLALTVRVRSAEDSADEVEVNLQKIDGLLYDDTYHRPRQEVLTL
jgi:hypothetical protein